MSDINGQDVVNDQRDKEKCKQNIGANDGYSNYLQLDKLLNSQTMSSLQNGRVFYDKHPFIVTHQDNHFVMVRKMIGSNSLGTGGTTGTEYLKSTLCDSYRLFMDLIDLPSIMLPATYVPPLTQLEN